MSDDRQLLIALWEKHGTSWESDPSEGVALADAILEAGFRRTVQPSDALGYIDQTMYANEDGEYVWTNVEMLEMLRDIRNLLAPTAKHPVTNGGATRGRRSPAATAPSPVPIEPLRG